MAQLNLSRRAFIQTSVTAGGGLLLGFHVPSVFAARVEPQPWKTPTNGVEINAWLTIDRDGTVTIRVPHTEMGQGALTSVAMMIAEELHVDWSRIQAVFADPNRHVNRGREYVETDTYGSALVRARHPHIMQAGASARERLKAAAAQAWGVPIEWDFGAAARTSTESHWAEAKQLLSQTGEVSNRTGGDTLGLIAAADKVVTAEYHRPWEAHARMEPVNATVSVTDTRVDVWSPTQDQTDALMLAADQTGRDPQDVFVHTVFLGGGFGAGGSGYTAVTRQAAEISRRLKRPVKVIWSRDEDIAQGKQRPPNITRFRAVLGEKGLPTAWFTRSVWFTQNGAPRVGGARADYAIGNMPYKVPNRHHELHNGKTHIPGATHRAPGANQHGFMTESFVDEVAIAGGWNPLDWRIEMTAGMEDWQRVLETLQAKSGFRTDLPKGEGMGVAVVESHGTIVGACAKVSVSRRGELRVEKVVLVVDSGHVINPLGGTEQCEGSVAWELSHALVGGLELREGRFTNTNFDSYNLLRIDQMPEVEVHFALSGGKKWGGLGEPGGPPIPPAVANAIYYATGKRIRSTPFRSHDLSWS